MIKRLFSILIIVTTLFSLASCNVKDKTVKPDDNSKPQTVSHTKPVTKIYNDLADTLPDFNFKSELQEYYDEGYSYSFTVKATQTEFNDYIKAVKNSGYSVSEVNGENYFFAMNANGFKLECMYKDGNIVLTVSR